MTDEQMNLLTYFREHIEPIVMNNDSKLVFYGLGINTKFLLENIDLKYVSGLMDAEHVGEVFFNQKVLSSEEVIQKAQIVIIVARPAYQNMIYRRISHLINHNIKIYNLYGMPFEDTSVNRSVDSLYWRNSYDDIYHLALNYDVVSFDIFDTLIMRKTLLPYHVFDEIEKRYEEKYNSYVPFRTVRYAAEEKAGQLKEAPSIDDIYSFISEEFGEFVSWRLRELELQMEQDMMVPRNDMHNLYNSLKNRKPSNIVLVSDMYFGSKQIEKFLLQCGYKDWDELIISCEYGKSKSKGTLFSVLKEKYPNHSILHIGDNKNSDFIMPRQHEVNSYLIHSAYDLLSNSVSQTLIDKIEGAPASRILGSFCADVCNSPFSLNEGKGALKVQSFREIGRAYLGPVFLCFIIFMLNALRSKEKPYLLLGARDGYVIQMILDSLKEAFPSLELPPYSYFLTSRRAVTMPTFTSERDVICSLRGLTGKTSIKKILEERFSLNVNDDKILELPAQYQELELAVKEHMEDILEQAAQEKINYLNYIANHFDIADSDIVLFDSMSSGTIPVNLQKLLNREITLLTMCFFDQGKASGINVNAMLDYNKAVVDKNQPGHCIARYFMLVESIMTSKDGQFISIDERGQAKFSKNYNLERISALEELWIGICEYICDNYSAVTIVSEKEYNSALKMADAIFGELISGHVILDERFKNIFVNEAYYTGGKRLNVWQILC